MRKRKSDSEVCALSWGAHLDFGHYLVLVSTACRAIQNVQTAVATYKWVLQFRSILST
jgi:hypothetical protein